jgi:hypothetical protein
VAYTDQEVLPWAFCPQPSGSRNRSVQAREMSIHFRQPGSRVYEIWGRWLCLLPPVRSAFRPQGRLAIPSVLQGQQHNIWASASVQAALVA